MTARRDSDLLLRTQSPRFRRVLAQLQNARLFETGTVRLSDASLKVDRISRVERTTCCSISFQDGSLTYTQYHLKSSSAVAKKIFWSSRTLVCGVPSRHSTGLGVA